MADVIKAFVLAVSPHKERGTKRKREEDEEEGKPEDKKADEESDEEEQDKKRTKMNEEEGMCQHPICIAR